MRRSPRTLPALRDTDGLRALPSWHPIPLREHLQAREGTIWQRKDTLLILERAEQIDTLIENLMRAAGLKTDTEQ